MMNGTDSDVRISDGEVGRSIREERAMQRPVSPTSMRFRKQRVGRLLTGIALTGALALASVAGLPTGARAQQAAEAPA